MNEKLKPCPFCGGKEIYLRQIELIDDELSPCLNCKRVRGKDVGWWEVGCCSCAVFLGLWNPKYKKAAIKAWNARAESGEESKHLRVALRLAVEKLREKDEDFAIHSGASMEGLFIFAAKEKDAT
jgi:hypothetical protein